MRRWISIAAIVLLAQAAWAQVSQDAIRAYNTALTSPSDRGAIITASEALMTEAIANPGEPDAALFAFEAAWTLCQIGECAHGRKGAEFAASLPATPDAHPSLATRQVLLSFIDWQKEQSNGHRRALVTALEQLPDGDVSSVSIAAHRDHYLYCASKGQWGDATKAADAAIAHLSAVQGEVFSEYATARMVSLTSGFNRRQSITHYEGMLDLKNEIDGEIDRLKASDADSAANALIPLSHLALAWDGAMSAYLTSSGEGDEVDRAKSVAEAAYTPVEPEEGLEERPGGVPFCGGGFEEPPRLRYPSTELRRGIVGSIVMGFGLDANGRPTDLQILASVPDNTFDDVALKAMDNLQWVAPEGTDASTCTLERKNIVFPFVFSIDG